MPISARHLYALNNPCYFAFETLRPDFRAKLPPPLEGKSILTVEAGYSVDRPVWHISVSIDGAKPIEGEAYRAAVAREILGSAGDPQSEVVQTSPETLGVTHLFRNLTHEEITQGSNGQGIRRADLRRSPLGQLRFRAMIPILTEIATRHKEGGGPAKDYLPKAEAEFLGVDPDQHIRTRQFRLERDMRLGSKF